AGLLPWTTRWETLMHRFSSIYCIAFWVLLTDGPLQAQPRQAADFNRHIRPILAKNCYACHGPDDSKRQAQLRLDQRDAAIATLPSGTAAIVPGDESASELYRRITSADADVRMPPAETGLALNEQQI